LPRIDFRAVVIAFAAEFVADLITGALVFAFFAHDLVTPEMSDADFLKVQKDILENTSCLFWLMLFGSATTIGGGYLAARIARQIPYYHGLAMGIVGIVYIVVQWDSDRPGLGWLGLLITIPLALFGAHLAKRQLEQRLP
jgi:hypothetical protein